MSKTVNVQRSSVAKRDWDGKNYESKSSRVNEEENHGLENHVDIYSHAHAKRFLCLMVYLNDDFEEGETYFPLFDVGSKTKAG